jgi:hypothetical protein
LVRGEGRDVNDDEGRQRSKAEALYFRASVHFTELNCAFMMMNMIPAKAEPLLLSLLIEL